MSKSKKATKKAKAKPVARKRAPKKAHPVKRLVERTVAARERKFRKVQRAARRKVQRAALARAAVKRQPSLSSYDSLLAKLFKDPKDQPIPYIPTSKAGELGSPMLVRFSDTMHAARPEAL